MRRWSVFLAAFMALLPLAQAQVSTSGSLVEEVLTQVPDPHRYDWRETPLQILVGYGEVEEENSFKSETYSLEFARSLTPTWLARFGARRVVSSATAASNALALTPYSQAGQPSRYELSLGAAYALLQGRVATPLAPRISDLGLALFAIGDVQYNLFDSTDPEPVPAMRAIDTRMAISLGLRFQVYLPENLGLSFEWAASTGLAGQSDPDLSTWQRFGLALSWSVPPSAFE